MNNTYNGLIAEYAAANLVESGIAELNNLVFQPKGLATTTIFSDVSNITFDESRCIISVSRPKPEDRFPDGLFYTTGDHLDSDDWRTEQQARDTFFQILTQEMDAMSMCILLHERDNLLWSDNSLREIWNLPQILTPRQQSILVEWMPELGQMIGNYDQISKCLTVIMGVPISIIVENSTTTSLIRCGQVQQIGKSIIGKETILGHKAETHWTQLTLAVGPVSWEAFHEWHSYGYKKEMLESLCEYFLPIDNMISIKTLAKIDSNASHEIGINSIIGCFSVSTPTILT